MLKYRFAPLAGKAARVRPFVGAGPAFWIENSRHPAVRVPDPHHGIVAGIGFDVQRRGWALSPQASYTRWATDADPGLSKNQVQILVRLSFWRLAVQRFQLKNQESPGRGIVRVIWIDGSVSSRQCLTYCAVGRGTYSR